MLNDSLKRRWSVTPVGLDLGYEPPEKVRLVTNSGGSSDSRTQPLKRRILQDNFSPLKRRNCEAVFKGDFTRTVAQTDKCGKRKLSSCVEQSGIGSCGGGDQTVVDSVNLEFSKPLKRPRRSQVEQCHFHSQAMASAFNEFNFWKPVLPDIEAELEALLLSKPPGGGAAPRGEKSVCGGGGGDPAPGSSGAGDACAEFNAFNFWRVPVPNMDIDLDIL